MTTSAKVIVLGGWLRAGEPLSATNGLHATVEASILTATDAITASAACSALDASARFAMALRLRREAEARNRELRIRK